MPPNPTSAVLEKHHMDLWNTSLNTSELWPESLKADAAPAQTVESSEEPAPLSDSFTLPEADAPERLPTSCPASPGSTMVAPKRPEGTGKMELGEDLFALMSQQHHEVMLQLSTQNRLLQEVLARGRPAFSPPPGGVAPVAPREKRPSTMSHGSVQSDQSSSTQKRGSPWRTSRSPKSDGKKPKKRRFLKSFSAMDRALRRMAEEAHAARAEILHTTQEHGGAKKRLAVRICQHPLFEVFFTLIVMANAIFIGVETQYAIDFPNDSRWDFFYVTATFTSLFIVELLIRIVAYGKNVFFGFDWAWGWLDLTISITSVLQLVDDFSILSEKDASGGDAVGSSSVWAFRIFRITRILRAVRVVRVLRFVTALRTLVTSIFHTLKSLFWALVLLVLIVYVFATLFAFAVNEHMRDPSMPELPEWEAQVAETHYSSVPRTMLSLFMSISGGLNWVNLALVLEEISVAWEFCFLFYVSFTYFAVLNVVTAVFCQAAIDSAQQDQASVIQSILENKEAHLAKIRDLFGQFGGEDCQTITFAMFEETIQEPKVREYFESLGLDIWDAWSFFKLLDLDSGGEVEIDEFLMGCLRLRGNARAVDVGKLIHDQNWLIKNFGKFQAHVELQLSHLMGLISVAIGADQMVEGVGPLLNGRAITPQGATDQKRSKEPNK